MCHHGTAAAAKKSPTGQVVKREVGGEKMEHKYQQPLQQVLHIADLQVPTTHHNPVAKVQAV